MTLNRVRKMKQDCNVRITHLACRRCHSTREDDDTTANLALFKNGEKLAHRLYTNALFIREEDENHVLLFVVGCGVEVEHTAALMGQTSQFNGKRSQATLSFHLVRTGR
jgi:hypothetical protein